MSEWLKPPLQDSNHQNRSDSFPTAESFMGGSIDVHEVDNLRQVNARLRLKLGKTVKMLEEAKHETYEACHQALIDPLTGCWNMRWYEKYMNDFDPACGNNDYGIAFIDIDDFGLFNKAEGQQKGDSILRELATFLSSNIRGKDAVARIGGDEFVIIFSNEPGIDRKKDPIFDRRKPGNFKVSNLLAVMEAKFRHIKDSPVNFSWGCAVYDSSKGDNTFWDTQQRANDEMKSKKPNDESVGA